MQKVKTLKRERLNQTFSERGYLGSTVKYLKVYEDYKLLLCKSSLQRVRKWTVRH